jgi:hypothetical protein
MLKEIVAKQSSTSHIVAVATIPSSSETETTSKFDSDKEVKQIVNAFQDLELKRMHKSKVTPTSLTKNWYPRPSPLGYSI